MIIPRKEVIVYVYKHHKVDQIIFKKFTKRKTTKKNNPLYAIYKNNKTSIMCGVILASAFVSTVPAIYLIHFWHVSAPVQLYK